MTRKKAIIIAAAVVLIATGAFAATAIPPRADEKDQAVSTPENKKEERSAEVRLTEIKPVNVKTAKIIADTLAEYVTASGATAAKTDVTFSAEIPGRIEYLGTDLGKKVKKGQILARIDYKTLQAQKNQAQANFDLASATYSRLATLGEGLVSRQKLDESSSALTSAKAMLAIAKANMQKSVVRSNISGVVTAKYVDKAEYVGPGAPMFRIVDYSAVVIEAQLPETQVALIDSKADVSVTVDALGEQFKGVVDAVLPAADPVSKMFTVRVKIDNPELRILVGMSASLKVEARIHEDVVVVSQDIVVEGKGRRSVFVAVGGNAEERVVRLGANEGDRVVILEGVEQGEELIVLGHRDLTNGQPIQVVR